jgi:hypothetical protein
MLGLTEAVRRARYCNSIGRAVDRQAGMKATMAHGARCNRVPCFVGKIRPDPRFAYVGMLAIQPFHYDFHHLGRWRGRQDLARALCRVTRLNGYGTRRPRIEWVGETWRDCNGRADGGQKGSPKHSVTLPKILLNRCAAFRRASSLALRSPRLAPLASADRAQPFVIALPIPAGRHGQRHIARQ